MKKLLKTMLVFIMVAVAVSCSDEEATVVPVKEDNIKTDTKISIEQARQDLLGLLADIDSERSRSYGKLPRTIKEAHSFKLGGNESRSEETPDYYVFNFDNNQGYAIMSGDERMPSLIALTDSGSFNENDSFDNPGLDIFYAKLDTGKIVITPIEPGGDGCINWGDSTYLHYMDWVNTVYKRKGYCPVKWGQGNPYRNYTFTDDYFPAPTGCAATAMAQYMAIYQYPKSYNSYSFNWEEMTYSQYGGFCSNEGMENIARLMEQLGTEQNLDTDYRINEGYSLPENIPRTFRAFGYTSGGVISDYSTSKMISEVASAHPVLAYGYNEKNQGHIWLIHGLLKRSRVIETRELKTKKVLKTEIETEWYPLCNWGSEGKHDGYYLGNVFDANKGPVYDDDMSIPEREESEEDLNFKNKLKIITGIRK